MKRIFIAVFTALAASKNSVAGAAVAGVGGAMLAPMIGFDPWPWVIGAVGGIIVRVKLPPTSRADTLANGAISVMLAVFAAPWIVRVAVASGIPEPSVYLVAFILAAAWPWLVLLGLQLIRRRTDRSKTND